MVVGATTSGVFLVAYVLAMEMVGPKFRLITFKNCTFKTRPVKLVGRVIIPYQVYQIIFTITFRVVAGTLCQYYYTAGYLLMALVAFLPSFTSRRSL